MSTSALNAHEDIQPYSDRWRWYWRGLSASRTSRCCRTCDWLVCCENCCRHKPFTAKNTTRTSRGVSHGAFVYVYEYTVYRWSNAQLIVRSVLLKLVPCDVWNYQNDDKLNRRSPCFTLNKGWTKLFAIKTQLIRCLILDVWLLERCSSWASCCG